MSDREQGSRANLLEDQRMRMIVESLDEYAIFMLDPTGHIESWNPGAERITGYTAREALGKHLSLLYPPGDDVQDRIEVELSTASRTGRYEEEGWRRRKDGSLFWCSVVLSAVRDAQGRLLGFAKVTRDITTRRDAETRLRESEERFRLLVSSVRDYAIFMLDPDGNIASWNAGAEAIKGYTADEIIGQHMSRFYTPEDAAAGRPAKLLGIARTQGRVEDEGWRVRKDGRRFWADVVLTAVFDGTGKLRGYAKVTRDLTDRRQAEEALRQSEERFRLLVEGVRDYALDMLDREGRVVTWNTGAQNIKGYTADEVIGRHISTFYTPEDAASGKAEAELTTALNEGRFEEEGWRVRKDGSRFWANVVLTAVRNAQGQHVGYAKVTRDLSDRRRLEEERLRLAQAQEAIRLRDEFLSIASHELKTPIAALQLQLDNLRERLAGDPGNASRLDRAIRSSDRLATLIELLLDVSRISTGRFVLHRQKLDLKEALTEWLERLAEPARRASVALELQAEDGVVGEWDPVRLEQVVSNIVSNSLKYAAGTRIVVRAQREGGSALIEVEDGGPGIPEEALPRVFERFERAAPMRNYGGLGLGLYVVRQIVEAHGGSAHAANAPGGGAVLSVRLPCLPQGATAEAAQ
ncbi:MAG: PAS domain S-box protein [Myxococcales bacterium]